MKAPVNKRSLTLDRAIQAVRTDTPSPQTLAESRARLQARLFGAPGATPTDAPIRGCDDVQSLLATYRRGELSAPRALLVRNHLTECASCRDVYSRRGALRLATTPWQRSAEPRLERPPRGRRPFAVLAAAIALCAAVLVARSAFFGAPDGQRGTVRIVSEVLYGITGATASRLEPGAPLGEGQVVRAGASPQSVVQLTDGSMVELGERAEFSLSTRGKDTTLHLNRGQIIVESAQRSLGHLHVVTRDCRVTATTGVFSVLASLKGTRVSVIQGEVQVAEGGGGKRALHRGDQVTTSPTLASTPIEQEVGWSRNLDEYLALLRELTELRKQWQTVHLPALRYEARFTRLVPDNTVVYAALPNYGEALNEGYRIFKERLGESEVLGKWWAESELGAQGKQLEDLIGTVHDLGGFLGDEVVIAGALDSDAQEEAQEVVVLAQVTKPGLRGLIGAEPAFAEGATFPITVLDQQDVASGALEEVRGNGALLLLTPSVAALSTAPAALAEVAARLESGDISAFPLSELGERVTRAYEGGVSLLLAADLETLSTSGAPSQAGGAAPRTMRRLLFEHKDVQGQSLSTGELSFAGHRDGVASWLAAPAPMGSLDYMTPHASAIAAFMVRRPAEVMNDMLRLDPNSNQALTKLLEFEANWNVRVQEDLAESLGSEVAVALDGPLLPKPSWKLVAEVVDADRLELGLEKLLRHADQELRKRGQGALVFEREVVHGYTYHRVETRGTQFPLEANYAFVDGYLVVTPSRALLSRAIQTHRQGESLARSSRFTSLLPRDGHASFSGVVFQDLMSVAAAALGSADVGMTADQQQGLETLLNESKPSLVGFYAREDRIEMAGVGNLFGTLSEGVALPELLRHTFPKPSAELGSDARQ